MGETPTSDDVEAFLNARLGGTPGRGASGGGVSTYEGGNVEPTPTPSPSPTPDGGEPTPTPSASPSPEPLSVHDADLIALVVQAKQEQTAARVAPSGSFVANCLMVSLLVAVLFFLALRRR